MDSPTQKIEIFAPFGAAFELMKRTLFKPFDLKKWLVIGFAAFLAHLSGGGGNGFNFNSSKFQDAKAHVTSTTQNAVSSADGIPMWVIPLAIVAVVVVIAVVVVLLWIGCRGRFIFLDCIVRNRGAIKEPWHEYRPEANSFFRFSLIVAAIVIVMLLVAALPLVLTLILHKGLGTGGTIGLITGVILLVFVLLLAAFAWSLISQFMVPVMYRRRCRAREAFSAVFGLMKAHLGPFVLYFLFTIVLGIAAAMIACVAACISCCIAAIPYVGTVILLPIYVTITAFSALFLRQFGSEFNAFQNASTTEASAVLPPPPTFPDPPPMPA